MNAVKTMALKKKPYIHKNESDSGSRVIIVGGNGGVVVAVVMKGNDLLH